MRKTEKEAMPGQSQAETNPSFPFQRLEDGGIVFNQSVIGMYKQYLATTTFRQKGEGSDAFSVTIDDNSSLATQYQKWVVGPYAHSTNKDGVPYSF